MKKFLYFSEDTRKGLPFYNFLFTQIPKKCIASKIFQTTPRNLSMVNQLTAFLDARNSDVSLKLRYNKFSTSYTKTLI